MTSEQQYVHTQLYIACSYINYILCTGRFTFPEPINEEIVLLAGPYPEPDETNLPSPQPIPEILMFRRC